MTFFCKKEKAICLKALLDKTLLYFLSEGGFALLAFEHFLNFFVVKIRVEEILKQKRYARFLLYA